LGCFEDRDEVRQRCSRGESRLGGEEVPIVRQALDRDVTRLFRDGRCRLSSADRRHCDSRSEKTDDERGK